MTERTMILATMSDSDDDVPLGSRMPALVKKATAKRDDSDSDDDVPLGARLPKPKPAKKSKSSSKPKPAKKRKAESDSDDTPIGSLLKDGKETKDKGKKDSKRASVGGARKKAKTGSRTASTKGKKMWKTLVHAGVVFPPAYEPHGVPLTYDGVDVVLLPHEEEVACFFAVMKDTDYAQKDVFTKNFFEGFKKVLRAGPHKHITTFSKCDFTKMYMWHLTEREKRKNVTNEEKKAAKVEKDAVEEKYCWATIDGRREKVGNYRVEPPGLFRGRGEHPKMGRVKKRIMPEDIIVNIGKGAPVPPPYQDTSGKP
tara:strand:- start:3174 stop:4109 length:936 start_codon:yes stop_codon:yes gene_type:complete